jgi:hypothetical protein
LGRVADPSVRVPVGQPNDQKQYETQVANLFEKQNQYFKERGNINSGLTEFQIKALGNEIRYEAGKTYPPAIITGWSCFIDEVTNTYIVPDDEAPRLRKLSKSSFLGWAFVVCHTGTVQYTLVVDGTETRKTLLNLKKGDRIVFTGIATINANNAMAVGGLDIHNNLWVLAHGITL